MSGAGAGGYYKYRCKYFYTHECPHWVWVNDAPCAHCLADGRDLDAAVMHRPFRLARDIYVPQIENGALHYIIMEIVATCDADSGWNVKDPNQSLPPTSEPPAVSSAAIEGLDAQKHTKSGLGVQGFGPAWAVKSSNPE